MASKNVVSITKKYTVPSTGIWERIRRVLAVDPNRSTGVPLNPQFRNPPPGALPPQSYDDPVTLPAADIADNPYWKRDVRRGYPKLSVVRQADVAGLLTVGSAANPRDDVLQLGEAGQKQLVQVQQDGEEKGLAALFEKDETSIGSVLNPDGLPPMPTPMHPGVSVRQYVMNEEQTYENNSGRVAMNCKTSQELNHTDFVPTFSVGNKPSPSHYFSRSYPSFAPRPSSLLPPLPCNLHHPLLPQHFCIPQSLHTPPLQHVYLPRDLLLEFETTANMETPVQGLIYSKNFWYTMDRIDMINVFSHGVPCGSWDTGSSQSPPTDLIHLKEYTDTIPFDNHWLYPCAICGKTIPEIYHGSAAFLGLTQNYYEADTNQIMCFWLTACGHLVCGTHFLGGGVPFHAQNQLPKAACPVCIDKHELVGLFWVLDITSDKHHPGIPKNYFAIPAQDEVTYLNQLTGIARVLWATKEKLEVAQAQRASVADSNFNLYRKQLKMTEELKTRYDALKSQNAKLLGGNLRTESFEKREEQIKFLLKEARDIFRENEHMAHALRKFGVVLDKPTRPSLSAIRKPSNESKGSSSEASFLDDEEVNRNRSQQVARRGGPDGMGSAPRASAGERGPSRELMPPPPRPSLVGTRGGNQALQPDLFASQEVSRVLGAPPTGPGAPQSLQSRLNPMSAPFVPALNPRSAPFIPAFNPRSAPFVPASQSEVSHPGSGEHLTSSLAQYEFQRSRVPSVLEGIPTTGRRLSLPRQSRGCQQGGSPNVTSPFFPTPSRPASSVSNVPRGQTASDQGPSGRMSSDGRRKARR